MATCVIFSPNVSLALRLLFNDNHHARQVEALGALLEDVRLNPQARVAHKSVKDRVKEQAQRQRHVAKRTIEMQQHKKEAEARKARYLKETGGMKYTAVAMANRS